MKKVVRAVSLMLLMAGVCGNAFAEENEAQRKFLVVKF